MQVPARAHSSSEVDTTGHSSLKMLHVCCTSGLLAEEARQEGRRRSPGWRRTANRSSPASGVRPPSARRKRPCSSQRDPEYATRWLTQRRVKGESLRANTVIDYERALRLYITPHLGERIPSEITRANLRDWHNNLPRSVSDRPKAKAYAVLRTIMNSAAEEELRDVNPVSIRGAGVARTKHGIEPASLDELAIIVEAMAVRFGLMVQLAKQLSRLAGW